MNATALTIAIFAGNSTPALHATLAASDRALEALRRDSPWPTEILLLPDESTPDLHASLAGIAEREDLRLLDVRPRWAARPDAVTAARGDLLAFIDAGDLWSGNFLQVAAAAALRESGPRSVWRPEVVIDGGLDFFDFDYRVTLQDPMAGTAPLQACPYAPTFLAHREVFAAAPFPMADAARGWLDVDAWWIAECVDAGHAQRIAEGTLVYRWAAERRIPHSVRIGPLRRFAGCQQDESP